MVFLNMDIPFVDLIFAGNFSGLNLSTLTIDKKNQFDW